MSIARRDFLKLAGSASLLGSLPTRSAVAAGTDNGVPAFGFAEDSVPMNAANLCPMPLAVSQAQAAYAAQLDRSLSSASRQQVEARKEDARQLIAAQLGTSADEIAIVRNTSEANNIIVQGLPFSGDDEILAWDQNHPSNLLAWQVQARRSGGAVRPFSIPVDTGSIDEVVERVVGAVSNKTRVVTFTHISNVTGFRLPAEEICKALRERHPGLYIHIDGAQTWGAVDINLEAVDCDSFSASAHKWFMGPRETGILFVRASRVEEIWPNVVSIPWFPGIDDVPAGSRKFDALGQRDDAAIAALVETAAMHEKLTPAGVERLSLALARRLYDGLADLDLPFVTSNNPAFASSVVILKAERENAGKLVEQVFRDAGVQTAATGGLRMTPHIYNSNDHVDRVIAAVGRNRKLLG